MVYQVQPNRCVGVPALARQASIAKEYAFWFPNVKHQLFLLPCNIVGQNPMDERSAGPRKRIGQQKKPERTPAFVLFEVNEV